MTFTLTLAPVDDRLPPYVRLRGGLKDLLRRHGLKCLSVQQTSHTGPAEGRAGAAMTSGMAEGRKCVRTNVEAPTEDFA